MIDKLSKFGSKEPEKPRPKRARVNLDRRFTILAQTAQGSMSRVHRALDKQNGRTVCLKVQTIDKNAAAVARASRDEARPDEGEVAMQIAHPNVVKTYECGISTRGELFLVMEFVDGPSLRLIREARSADLERKIDLLTQAAHALAAVHAAGYIHHDIGPHNFLVNREGRVKLIDFGLAIPNTPAFRRPGNRTGTVQYLAPEVVRREAKDERLDIFAFGAMAFEFLTDKLPYDLSQAQTNSLAILLQRINSDPLDPADADPTLHPALAAILRKATARRREDRYASMSDLIRDLEALPPEARGEVPAASRSAPTRDQAADDSFDVPIPWDEGPASRPAGGVFLVRSGPLYLMRKSSHLGRRLEKMKQLPGNVEVVHTIPSPDPQRAESFWRERFQGKHQKDSWFALSPEDVAEFKSYSEMSFREE